MREPKQRPRIPLWRWGFWWFLLMIGMKFFINKSVYHARQACIIHFIKK